MLCVRFLTDEWVGCPDDQQQKEEEWEGQGGVR